MKVTIELSKNKLRQVFALVSMQMGDEIPEDIIEEIVNTPEVDITEYVNKDKDEQQTALAIACTVVPMLLEKIDPKRYETERPTE